VSGKLRALKRHIDPEYSNIPKKDLVVVINSKFDPFVQRAEKWCKDEGIEYHITESDGTPGTGKNSLFEVFLASDDDYMVQIDGDDFLTPHGVWLYKHIANTQSPPDIVCLLNQISLTYNWTAVNYIESGKDNDDDPFYKVDKSEWPITTAQPFHSPPLKLIENTTIEHYMRRGNRNRARAMRFQSYNQKFLKLAEKYVDANESHCRVVFYSRKAIKKSEFCGLQVGEDTILYYKLKHMGLCGELDVRTNVELPATYIYDETLDGVVSNASNHGTDLNWMWTFIREVRKLEKKNMLHAYTNLPELKVDYPADYEPDSLDLSNQYEFPYNVNGMSGTLKAPANSSEKTLMDKYMYRLNKTSL